MKKTAAVLLIFLLLLPILHLTPSLTACTTFCLKDGTRLVFGRNYDWGIGHGYVMVNKRNLAKKAFNFDDPESKPVEWISKFGSITFNQYGKEQPMGGMNEAGLVVEVMWLAGTTYPDFDPRPALGELPWVQYQLDNFSTVTDVIESDDSIRISTSSQPIHFLVCDQTGDVATIEFLNGKMIFNTGNSLPMDVLTNNTYEDSIQYLGEHKGFGGTRDIPATESSLDRFARAADMLQKFKMDRNRDIVNYSFSILENVKQEVGTQWSIVYDPKNMVVHFKTKETPKTKSFNFKDFDFACHTPSMVLDMHSNQEGDVGPYFMEYSSELNRRLIGLSFRGTDFLQDTPNETLDQLARYPESLICRTKKWDLYHISYISLADLSC
ncbi:linear amide C-N hydrolase [Acidobacteriota bacterium]